MQQQGTPAPGTHGESAAWGDFWSHGRAGAALPPHAGGDEVLARFWEGLFARLPASARVLDVACGDGDVARRASSFAAAAAAGRWSVFALDASHTAVQSVRRHASGIQALVGDARRLPFPDGAFDLAASQFGAEYGGATAVLEMARTVGPNGLLGAILHYRDGAMYRENVRSLEAARELSGVALLPGLEALFHAAIAVSTGRGGPDALRVADGSLQERLSRVSSLLGRLGAGVAGGMVQRLAADVDHMRRRLSFQDPARALEWAGFMRRELVAYEGRLSSMIAASLDAEEVEALARGLEGRGFALRLRESTPLGRASGEPAAWLLVAQRP